MSQSHLPVREGGLHPFDILERITLWPTLSKRIIWLHYTYHSHMLTPRRIIALHGLDGHWENTWTSTDESTDEAFCWIRDGLSVEFPSALHFLIPILFVTRNRHEYYH